VEVDDVRLDRAERAHQAGRVEHRESAEQVDRDDLRHAVEPCREPAGILQRDHGMLEAMPVAPLDEPQHHALEAAGVEVEDDVSYPSLHGRLWSTITLDVDCSIHVNGPHPPGKLTLSGPRFLP
jgi:hypothetical protein